VPVGCSLAISLKRDVVGGFTVATSAVKYLENIKHGHSCLQCRFVSRGNEVRNECCFHDQSCHAAQHCRRHVFVSREEVHDENSHDVDSEGKSEPACRIEKLLYLGEALIAS
jgi:hypothetical protein